MRRLAIIAMGLVAACADESPPPQQPAASQPTQPQPLFTDAEINQMAETTRRSISDQRLKNDGPALRSPPARTRRSAESIEAERAFFEGVRQRELERRIEALERERMISDSRR